MAYTITYAGYTREGSENVMALRPGEGERGEGGHHEWAPDVDIL